MLRPVAYRAAHPGFHHPTAQLPFQPASMPHVPMVFDPPAKPPQWEYHVITIDPREDEPLAGAPLAALGADGWLLAGILQSPAGNAVERIVYYFVRPAL